MQVAVSSDEKQKKEKAKKENLMKSKTRKIIKPTKN